MPSPRGYPNPGVSLGLRRCRRTLHPEPPGYPELGPHVDTMPPLYAVPQTHTPTGGADAPPLSTGGPQACSPPAWLGALFPQVCYNKTLLQPQLIPLLSQGGLRRADGEGTPSGAPQAPPRTPSHHHRPPRRTASAHLGTSLTPAPPSLPRGRVSCPGHSVRTHTPCSVHSLPGAWPWGAGTPQRRPSPLPATQGARGALACDPKLPSRGGSQTAAFLRAPGARGLRAGGVTEPEPPACTSG